MQEEEKEVFLCSECEYRSDVAFTYKNIDGESICDNCYEDHYFVCDNCSELCNHGESRDSCDGYICDDCYDSHYFTCVNCEGVERESNICTHNDEYYCNSCYEDMGLEEEDSVSFKREYNKSNKYTESNKRFFSTEIECYYPNDTAMKKVFKEMNQDFGVAHDGSLSSNGIEFQTPKLSGKKGKKELVEFCKLLNKNKFTVNQTCGLHVHLDVSDYMDIKKDFTPNYNEDSHTTNEYKVKLDKIKNLITFYLAFESVIFSYLPKSRRKNRYCFPLSECYHEKEIQSKYILEDLEQMWYREAEKRIVEKRKESRYDDSRYAGINFHSMLANKHIEIRFHSGTINSDKILNWIGLHVYILNNIYEGKINYSQLQDVKYITELSDKQDYMFSLLNLPKEIEDYLRERAIKFRGNDDDYTELN